MKTTADVLREEGYHNAIMEKPQWVAEGELKATQDTLIDQAAELYGPLPGMLQIKIKSIQSIDNLRVLASKIIRTESLDEFTELVNKKSMGTG